MIVNTVAPPPPTNPCSPSIVLVDDGFNAQSIFIKDSKPCTGIVAVVKAQNFQANKDAFQIKIVAKVGKEKDMIETTNKEDNGDGIFSIQFNIKEGCKPSIFAYTITYRDQYIDLETEESKPFKVITNQNQMSAAERDVTEYQFFRDRDDVSREYFYTELQSILLQKTQGYEAMYNTAADDSKGLVSKHRKVTKIEQDAIANHFFGDADPIVKGEAFGKFFEWFRATCDILRNPPFNEMYAAGFIFVHLDNAAIKKVMEHYDSSTFMLVCGVKTPGTVGLIVKEAGGAVKKRALVPYSKDVSGVVSNLKKYVGLEKILRQSGEEMTPVDKNEALGGFLSQDQAHSNEDFMDSPLYV